MNKNTNNTTAKANTNTTVNTPQAATTKKPYTRTVRQYFLFKQGKGFMLKNPKGAPTFGIDGELVCYNDIRQAKFARDFFVETAHLVDALDIVTKVA